MWKPTDALPMSSEQRTMLEAWVHAKTTPQRVVLRSRICLLAAAGAANNSIANSLSTSRPTVLQWRERFATLGPAGLAEDAPHGPSSRRLAAETVRSIVDATLQTTPPGATHWSTRTLAEKMGVGHATVARIWDAHGLQPHRIETFKLSRDKRFVEKLTDVVGLYLNPPDKALVLCVDEKSQIQALDRTQPGLPMKKGRCGTMTHDYKRNGTATLFAALNTLDGTVISMCDDRHRHQEWLKFLRVIDQLNPEAKEIHLIADNYATHKHPKVQRWLARRPRFQMHFTPTGSSWLNMVERFFRDLTDKSLRRGVFRDVEELIRAIGNYIDHHNLEPKPFIWTAKATDILEKVKRARAARDRRSA
jgi:transposase